MIDPPASPKLTGWKWYWAHWHHVTNGEADCGKFTVSIIGGGQPRRTWPKTLREARRHAEEPVCLTCLRSHQ